MFVFGAALAFAGLVASALALGARTASSRAACVYPARFRVIPDARAWHISLCLVSERAGDFAVRRVRVAGRDVTAAAAAKTPSLPVNVGTMPVAYQIRSAWQAHVGAALAAAECAQLIIPVDTLIPTPRSGSQYPVTVELHAPSSGQTVKFTTIAAVRSLPDDPDWIPADLHIHSRASDGKREAGDLVQPLQDMGYRVVYFTDHVDRTSERYPDWTAYAAYVTGVTANNPGIRFYPGNEFTVANGDGKAQGDLLAYGISSYRGLENLQHSPQAGIDNVLGNNPAGPSSASIAHPYRIPSWTDWSVTRHRGYELMSGRAMVGFSDEAPAPTRWREELQAETTTAWFASARAGSDWHETILDPEHPGYVTWLNTGRWDSKAAVDAAIHAGRTVASRKGSLGYMTLTTASGIAGVGDTLTGVPAGSPVQVRITFRPIASARYFIEVCTDDQAQRVFESGGVWCEALQGYTLTGQFAAAGGAHYYYLFIHTRGDRSEDEYVYSSPIFVSAL